MLHDGAIVMMIYFLLCQMKKISRFVKTFVAIMFLWCLVSNLCDDIYSQWNPGPNSHSLFTLSHIWQKCQPIWHQVEISMYSHMERMRTQGLTPYATQLFIATFKPRLYLVGDNKWDTFVRINKNISRTLPCLEG